MAPVFPSVRTDLLLIHPPAFFDFRGRSDVSFPYLSTSGDVPITPLYEYFPLGFKTLQRFLGERGHDVRIVNLASVLLKFPATDVRAFLGVVETRLFGIDLHWMVHVQGALEVAALVKEVHPDVPVVLGGLSSTYYASELIRYPFVDMVMRGYDTHEPMAGLMDALASGTPPATVPNLLWKDRNGEIVDNGFTHLPNSLTCGVDWSRLPDDPGRSTLPILEVVSTTTAGCSYHCGWCGGSREAFRRLFPRRTATARKPMDEVGAEFASMERLDGHERYHLYSVGSYNEPRERMRTLLEMVASSGVRSIGYEQYELTPDDVLERMAKANSRTSITLSPESHDLRVAKLAGRGVYTMDEMERWIRRALDAGIHEVDVWFFIGMPEQDERSVFETVEYCERLLRLFPGERVIPLLCPMIPFLDPGSTFFEQPAEHGYRVFHRTVEEHRRGMERASLINRINYETRWLSRSDLVHVGYRAVRRLVEIKGELGALPQGIARSVVERIDDALEWIGVVHAADAIPDERSRRRELEAIGGEIRRRNDEVLFGGVTNQAFPVRREVGGRWFDELLQEPAAFEGAGA